ncbi:MULTISPECIES: hypothetical protein [Nocardia]|uniref:WXG100 family type VII secretion target n=2 Tax=Nocardia TaxID=1817 RepID=A0A2T2YVW0_9NOCA|nr:MULTISPECIES: hypothetical protein [Nocardia]MBF6242284.1 hypothetical protein [Nocardia elegans]MBF6446885.1 hypothetical protein [Nocardia elegans]PSR59647.1 hypothetical protein C8259_25665 [Nocardia nova]
MAEKIEVDVDALTRAADLPEDVSHKVRGVIDTLHSTLAGIENDSTNQPWGNDKSGKKFADGDKGYKATRANMVDGGYSMADALFQFAEGERSAADQFRAAEQGSTQGLGG